MCCEGCERAGDRAGRSSRQSRCSHDFERRAAASAVTLSTINHHPFPPPLSTMSNPNAISIEVGSVSTSASKQPSNRKAARAAAKSGRGGRPAPFVPPVVAETDDSGNAIVPPTGEKKKKKFFHRKEKDDFVPVEKELGVSKIKAALRQAKRFLNKVSRLIRRCPWRASAVYCVRDREELGRGTAEGRSGRGIWELLDSKAELHRRDASQPLRCMSSVPCLSPSPLPRIA